MEQEEEKTEEILQCNDKKYDSLLSVFLPRKGFMATATLIYGNILIFILMAIAGVGIFMPDTLGLLQWGADFGPLTLTGDWWRTLTCNFIHLGILHLIMNIYALLFICLWLEPLIGTRRMFVSYILTGLCSAAVSLFMHSDLISAGASGSIFGLYGIFLAFLFSHRIEKNQRQALLASILIFVGYNLLNGLTEGIDNAAHVGGLISGLILGYTYVFAYRQEKSSTQRIITSAGEIGLFLLFLAGFITLCENIPSDYKEVRELWNDGTVQAYLGEDGDEEEQLPPYQVATNTDWYHFIDTESNFACQYPSNWTKEHTPAGSSDLIPPLLELSNGVNSLTITKATCSNSDEFETAKKELLHLPDFQDYEHIQNNINGIQYEVLTGVHEVSGLKLDQTILFHFPDSKEYILTISALYNDDRAKDDLNKIIETIRP